MDDHPMRARAARAALTTFLVTTMAACGDGSEPVVRTTSTSALSDADQCFAQDLWDLYFPWLYPPSASTFDGRWTARVVGGWDNTFYFGLPGDVPFFVRDRRGNSILDRYPEPLYGYTIVPVVWRPSEATWYLGSSCGDNSNPKVIHFGLVGDVPMIVDAGHFLGGVNDYWSTGSLLAVYRPSTQDLYIDKSFEDYREDNTLVIHFAHDPCDYGFEVACPSK